VDIVESFSQFCGNSVDNFNGVVDKPALFVDKAKKSPFLRRVKFTKKGHICG
jgi:hypothetical protein